MKDRAKKSGAAQEKREEADRELDEALEESFPASDPIATTGTSPGAPDDHASQKKPEKKSGR